MYLQYIIQRIRLLSLAPSPAEIEGVRKSTRIKHDARLRKHMSMFVMESRKGDKRSRGSDSSDVDDYDDIIPEKIPRKVEKKGA